MQTLALLGKYVHHFTAQSTIVIPGPLHGLATDDLFVQVYDSTGNTLGAMATNINASTYDVVITAVQPMSGRVILIG
jgi:hypothetical protein